MLRTLMKSKIHRATVTQATCTTSVRDVDENLLEARLLPASSCTSRRDQRPASRPTRSPPTRLRRTRHQRGARAWCTQATWSLIAYGQMDSTEARSSHRAVVFVDADTRIVGTARPRGGVAGMELVRGDLHSFAPSDLAVDSLPG